MITRQLTNPDSIAVVENSSYETNMARAILGNLISTFKGDIYLVGEASAPDGEKVRCFEDVIALPAVDCAMICLPPASCPDAVDTLVNKKGCRAVIIFSTGFREKGKEEKVAEDRMREICDRAGATLMGPSCAGIITPAYAGMYCPIAPSLSCDGATLISESGSAIINLIETAPLTGLPFHSVFSVGDSLQNGVEDILEHLDRCKVPGTGSSVAVLFMENIRDPQKLLRHASSLIGKGVRICAVKTGATQAGQRAAHSHPGAQKSPEAAVDALFRKAGIIRCRGRYELLTVAAAMMLPRPRGKNLAVITKAEGLGILQADALVSGGLSIPDLSDTAEEALQSKLQWGASVANPFDLRSSGTPEQLEYVLDFCQDSGSVDGITVILGSSGLSDLGDVCSLLLKKMHTCSKPIYLVLASISNAAAEIEEFHRAGGISFPDEVMLARALAKINEGDRCRNTGFSAPPVDKYRIREVIARNGDGPLQPEQIHILLDASGIDRAREASAYSEDEALEAVREVGGYPIVMKVISPAGTMEESATPITIHEDNIMISEFRRMMRIPEAEGVLFQPLLSGTKFFIRATKVGQFGHLLQCTVPGTAEDPWAGTESALTPVGREEADGMIQALDRQGMLYRNGLDDGTVNTVLNDALRRISALCCTAPEIRGLEIKALIGESRSVKAVDVRLSIYK